MDVAPPPASPVPVVVGERPSALRKLLRPLAFMTLPTATLAFLFLLPMGILAYFSFQYGDLSGQSGFTLTNFTDIIGDSLYREIAWTTFQIATIAMIAQLIVGLPLAYVLAFKAGKFELPLLLALVLADELNPMVRIYAWRMLLGREGLINEALMSIG
ncbi:MAG: ABC transporter permease, partial [Solirubrobacterales bacterium]